MSSAASWLAAAVVVVLVVPKAPVQHLREQTAGMVEMVGMVHSVLVEAVLVSDMEQAAVVEPE